MKHLAVVISTPLEKRLRPVGRQFLLNLQMNIFTFLGTKGFHLVLILWSMGSKARSMQCRRRATVNSFFPSSFQIQRSFSLLSQEVGSNSHNYAKELNSLLVLRGLRHVQLHPMLSRRSLIKQSLLTSSAISLGNFDANNSHPHQVSFQNRVEEPFRNCCFTMSGPIAWISWTCRIEVTILDYYTLFNIKKENNSSNYLLKCHY